MHSRKVIALVIKSKTCGVCTTWKKKNPDLDENMMPDHTCWKNHVGSSGSMESSGCLELVVNLFDKYNVVVHRLCCDDDSSIRADCQWSNANYLANNNTDVLPMVPKKVGVNKGKLQVRPDEGKLPAHVPEPVFVADPNHRRKGLTGELIKLDKSTTDKRFTMTGMDSTRIGKNFGYMARTLKDQPHSEFLTAAGAVLDHHFDCHDHCGAWCKRKNMTEQQCWLLKKYYRCKALNAKLCGVLFDKIQRFITMDKLLEMAHGLDTNMNECFNNICTWFAPKNKVYAASGSLRNRITFAVGITLVGVLQFYKRLFRKMGIPMTTNVEHYLQKKESFRLKKLARIRTGEAKKNKNKRKYDKLKEHTRTEKIEFHKRQGTYRKGMNLDDPFGELLNGAVVEDEDNSDKKPPTKPSGFCEYCGKSDHVTKRSKKCTAPLDSAKRFRRQDGLLLTDNATGNTSTTKNQEQQPNLDSLLWAVATIPPTHDDAAEDVDRYDSLPWNAALSDDERETQSLDFHDDAGTWDTDDDEEGDDINIDCII